MPIEDSTPLRAILEEVEKPHSLSPENDERNREYLIRRAALGDNPTQEEMRAVVEYGLQQHRLNFPQLYEAASGKSKDNEDSLPLPSPSNNLSQELFDHMRESIRNRQFSRQKAANQSASIQETLLSG